MKSYYTKDIDAEYFKDAENCKCGSRNLEFYHSIASSYKYIFCRDCKYKSESDFGRELAIKQWNKEVGRGHMARLRIIMDGDYD